MIHTRITTVLFKSYSQNVKRKFFFSAKNYQPKDHDDLNQSDARAVAVAQGKCQLTVLPSLYRSRD